MNFGSANNLVIKREFSIGTLTLSCQQAGALTRAKRKAKQLKVLLPYVLFIPLILFSTYQIQQTL